jgi:uncharacterized protein (DUF433 family)
MIDTPVSEQIPIRADQYGRLRVGDTRVLPDLVIYAYWRGRTPESIVERYPSLSLDDVYLAMGYYLRHRESVDAYLRAQEAEAERGQREDEAQHPRTLTREALLARVDSQ